MEFPDRRRCVLLAGKCRPHRRWDSGFRGRKPGRKRLCDNGSTHAQIWSFPVGDWVNSSPSLADLNGDGTPDAIVGALDGNVYALNGKTGLPIWTFPTGSYIWSSPSLADLNGDSVPDVIVGANSSNVYAIDGATGHQISDIPVAGPNLVVSGHDRTFNGDNVPDALIGSDDHNLYALDGTNGNLIFAFPTGDWIDSSPCVGDVDPVETVALDFSNRHTLNANF